MATTAIYSGSTTFFAESEDTTYLLAAGQIRTASGSSAIKSDTLKDDRSFVINGQIEGCNVGLNVGNQAIHSNITIGSTGYVEADAIGIFAAARNSTLTNYGMIVSGKADYNTAISFSGNDNVLKNFGSISSAGAAISMSGDDLLISNSGVISGKRGIIISSADGENAKIVNTGFIMTQYDSAITGGSGADTVINTGKIAGNVELGWGNDTYISNKGSLSGYVFGGAGNDTFIFNTSGMVVSELTNSGTDTMKGSVSFTVADNVERGFLTGTGNINLTGNNEHNYLAGNAGANKISGGVGMDTIIGGAGNDRLTGGVEADYFVFKFNSDKDVITDFADGTDRINLSAYAGIDSFSDIKNRIHDAGDNVVIDLLNGDSITLLNMDKAHLSMADFMF